MTKYVAFLRGINAGVSVKMDVLRQIFAQLGLTDVQTVLATGNALFEYDSADTVDLELRIENSVTEVLGYSTTAIVLESDALKHLDKKAPFKGIAVNSATVPQVTFIKSAKAATSVEYPIKGKGYRILGMVDRAVFSTVDLSGATTPDLMRVLEKQYGSQITTRNWKTIEKILQRIDQL